MKTCIITKTFNGLENISTPLEIEEYEYVVNILNIHGYNISNIKFPSDPNERYIHLNSDKSVHIGSISNNEINLRLSLNYFSSLLREKNSEFQILHIIHSDKGSSLTKKEWDILKDRLGLEKNYPTKSQQRFIRIYKNSVKWGESTYLETSFFGIGFSDFLNTIYQEAV